MIKIKVGLCVSSHCNMKCLFCYSRQLRNNRIDLNIEDLEKFLNINYTVIEDVNYGTSENVLSYNFDKIVNLVSDFNIPQALTTNGSVALKEEWLRLVLDHICEVDVSLDFPDRRHDMARGINGAYRLVLKTLQELTGNVKITLVCVLFNLNTQPEIVLKLLELANRYNALMRFNIYFPHRVNDPLFPNLFKLYETLRVIFTHSKVISLSEPVIAALLKMKFKEYMGKSVRIYADGSIFPLVYVTDPTYILGNISEGLYLKELSHHQILLKLATIPPPEECKSCIYVDCCKGGTKDRRIIASRQNVRDPICPFSFTSNNPLDLNIDLEKDHTIHSSYLPTIIVKPNLGENYRCL